MPKWSLLPDRIVNSMGNHVSTIKAAKFLDGQKKGSKIEKAKLEILSFEVAKVMAKVVRLWQSLSEQEIMRLRTDVVKSEGVMNLVSENEVVLLSLACMEKLQDLTSIAGAVARMGKKCQEPILSGFEHVYSDILKQKIDVRSWEYPFKDMERKVKKMEQYIDSTSSLYCELETQANVEQALRRMQGDESNSSRDKEAMEEKLELQKQETKYVKDTSLWNRPYEKVVTLLARTVCTIHGRILNVFGSPLLRLPQLYPVEKLRDGDPSPLFLDMPVKSLSYHRGLDVLATNAVAAQSVMQSHRPGSRELIHGNGMGPSSSSTPATSTSKVSPLAWDIWKSSSHDQFCGPKFVSEKQSHAARHLPPQNSSHLSSSVSVDISQQVGLEYSAGAARSSNGNGGLPNRGPGTTSISSVVDTQISGVKNARFSGVPDQQLRRSGAMDPRRSSGDHLPKSDVFGLSGEKRMVYFDPKNRHLNAPASTLGGAALAVHYANVIIMIEKMIKNPHLISHDSRDDLYHMLPNSVRAAVRSRLRASLRGNSGYDAGIAEHWKEALERILDWLTPLAHNMIRWQSEHNFEQQQIIPRSNILLLQTLFFADLAKTEAHITELLVGLNYICGHEKEKASLMMEEYEGSQNLAEDYFEWQFQ
ncbi:hypothetical protein R1flu_024763 [Riccia fluitans]|uniref:Uncharacterized protein n=1 Tax=Riccia fluitans TaxID=41844 RepID=A0ABD1XVU1_9MARC